MQHTPPEGSPVDPPSSSWTPFMGGAGRKRSIGQPMTDAGSSGITIPHKIGASAHGGLEYHRYPAFEAKSAAAVYSHRLVLMPETSVYLFLSALWHVAQGSSCMSQHHGNTRFDLLCSSAESLFLPEPLCAASGSVLICLSLSKTLAATSRYQPEHRH